MAVRLRQKRWPTRDSTNARQAYVSFPRNDPLTDPDCGTPGRTTYG